MKKLSVGVIGLLVIIIFIFEIYYNNEYNAEELPCFRFWLWKTTRI